MNHCKSYVNRKLFLTDNRDSVRVPNRAMEALTTMKCTIQCQVQRLETLRRYPRKEGSATELDYGKPQVDYTVASVRALANNAGIEGQFTIETNQLAFGQFVSVSLQSGSNAAEVLYTAPLPGRTPEVK